MNYRVVLAAAEYTWLNKNKPFPGLCAIRKTLRFKLVMAWLIFLQIFTCIGLFIASDGVCFHVPGAVLSRAT